MGRVTRGRTRASRLMLVAAWPIMTMALAGCPDRGRTGAEPVPAAGPRAQEARPGAPDAAGAAAAARTPDPRFPELPLSASGLTLRVEVPARVTPGEDFPITAIFTYEGDGEVAVLPRACSVQFASRGPQRADYVPLPGPPKDIYPDAQLVRRGRPVRAVVRFDVARAGAVWRLPAGPYDLTLRYGVGPGTRLPEPSPLARATVWSGALASAPVPITVVAK